MAACLFPLDLENKSTCHWRPSNDVLNITHTPYHLPHSGRMKVSIVQAQREPNKLTNPSKGGKGPVCHLLIIIQNGTNGNIQTCWKVFIVKNIH